MSNDVDPGCLDLAPGTAADMDLTPASGLVDLHDAFELADRILDQWRGLGVECRVLGLRRGRILAHRQLGRIWSETTFEDATDGARFTLPVIRAVLLARPSPPTANDRLWLVVGRIAGRELVLALLDSTPELERLWPELLTESNGELH